jgi:hypothetical protein
MFKISVLAKSIRKTVLLAVLFCLVGAPFSPQPTGGAVTLGVLGPSLTWTANNYIGPASTAASSGAAQAAWIAPARGTLKNFRFNASGAVFGTTATLSIYQGFATCSGSGPNTVAATIVIPVGPATGNNLTTTVSVVGGECYLVRTDTALATGAGGGAVVTAQFIPLSP